MIFLELKEKLEALKLKMYYKIFKQLTSWDSNYLRFVDDEVVRGIFLIGFHVIKILQFLEKYNNCCG